MLENIAKKQIPNPILTKKLSKKVSKSLILNRFKTKNPHNDVRISVTNIINVKSKNAM